MVVLKLDKLFLIINSDDSMTCAIIAYSIKVLVKVRVATMAILNPDFFNKYIST